MSKLIGPIKSWCDTFHANIFWNSRNWPSVATQAAPTSPSIASSIYVKLLKLLALIFVFFLLILAFFTLWWRHLSEAVHNGNNAFLKLHYRYMDYVHTTYSWNIKWQKCAGISGLWVLNEIIQNIYLENMRKMVGAVWKLPAK